MSVLVSCIKEMNIKHSTLYIYIYIHVITVTALQEQWRRICRSRL